MQDQKPEPKPGQNAIKARMTEKTENGWTVISLVRKYKVV